MSRFKKHLNNIREAKIKTAEGEDSNAAQFIDLCAEYGLNLTDADLDNAANTKEGKVTPFILMTAPGQGAAFVEEVMAQADTESAANMVINKIKEINDKFVGQGFDQWFGGVSDQKIRELEVKLPTFKRKGMTGPQAIGMYVYDGMQMFLGDGVISTNPKWAELEDEELEKKAKQLVAEFEGRVRSLLAEASKKKASLENKHLEALITSIAEEAGKQNVDEIIDNINSRRNLTSTMSVAEIEEAVNEAIEDINHA